MKVFERKKKIALGLKPDDLHMEQSNNNNKQQQQQQNHARSLINAVIVG